MNVNELKLVILLFCACISISTRALGSFDSGDLSSARDHVDSLSSTGRHSFSRDPEVFPLWDPGQLLNTSQLLLLKAATSQAVDEGSDSDSISVTSEGDYGPKYVLYKFVFSPAYMYVVPKACRPNKPSV